MSPELTLLKPFSKGKVGLKPLNIPHWSVSAEHDNGSNVGENEGSERMDTSSIIDFVTKVHQLINGKHYYKASVIRQLLNDPSSSSSKDRLKRVQGLSKYMQMVGHKIYIDIEDIIILGDSLVFMIDA